jgi:hypothetical protein
VKLSEEIDEAYKKLRKAEIILSSGYEDKELKKLAAEIREAREVLTNASLQIVKRAMRTEDQQRKWLDALLVMDVGLSELEDKLTKEEYDIIKSLRKRLDDSFED